MRPGEKVIDRLDAVEDTKGNNGDRGQNVSDFNTRVVGLPLFCSYMWWARFGH